MCIIANPHVHNDEHDAGAVTDVQHGVRAEPGGKHVRGGGGYGDGDGGEEEQTAGGFVGLGVEGLLGEVDAPKQEAAACVGWTWAIPPTM